MKHPDFNGEVCFDLTIEAPRLAVVVAPWGCRACRGVCGGTVFARSANLSVEIVSSTEKSTRDAPAVRVVCSRPTRPCGGGLLIQTPGRMGEWRDNKCLTVVQVRGGHHDQGCLGVPAQRLLHSRVPLPFRKDQEGTRKGGFACSSRVSLESRYGMWPLPSASALMT